MGQRFRVEREMTPEDRKSFDDFLRDRRPTVDEAWEFVVGLGYTGVSRSAVYGYMVSNEDQLNDLRSAAEGAKAWADVAKESGAVAFNEAALANLSQRFMQMIFDMGKAGEVDPKAMIDTALGLQRLSRSNATLTSIRETERKRAREEAAEAVTKALQGKVASKKAITDDDIAEVRKAVFG
jgi:hypothetical protein